MKSLFAKLMALSITMLVSLYSFSTTYYVATNGSDNNTGISLAAPFATVAHAVSKVAAGDTIYVRSGVYVTSATITMSKSGTAAKHITLSSYKPDLTTVFNNNRPVLDFSAAFATAGSSERGVQLDADYWNVYGLVIYGAGDNGMNVSGSYCNIEFCVFTHSRDAGIQLGGGASYDHIINCDSYDNADMGAGTTTDGGNADGFSPKLDVGDSIYLRGCRSWNNSDDGYDGYLRPTGGLSWVIEDCWSFHNGYYWADGTTTSTMNGQGFKTGGSDNKDLAHNCTIIKCLSFMNKGHGYDQNSNAGSIYIYNCTGYSNSSSDIYMASPSTNFASGATLVLNNNLTLGANGVSAFLTSAASGTRTLDTATNSFSKNTTSAEILSFDTTGVTGPRALDGSLPSLNFMHLNPAAAKPYTYIDKGTILSTVVYHGVMGVPYNGTAPDLGCYETTTTTPVTLLSFYAVNKDNTALLKWESATEINAAYYNIQRSTDGISFTTIGKENTVGAGYNYTYNDATLSTITASTVYYRLQEVDNDGSTTYSAIAPVSLNGNTFTLYPNPATSYINIESSKSTTGAIALITDALGRTLLIKTLSGSQLQQIPLGSLPKGLYNISIISSGSKQTQQIVVQ